ncbi:MAG TPA: hypothetical protein DC000_00235 [Clostridiales bacterium]|nr:hypothetical protein [Clostridiales bacterium]
MAKLLDLLKANGIEITEEIEQKVLEEFVDKTGVQLKDTEIEELKEQLKARNIDIEELKKIDVNELQTKLTSMEEKYAADTETLNKKLSDTQFDNALEIAIMKTNAKDNVLIKTLLNKEKINFKDGKVEGFDEQIEQIKKEKDYLFNTEDTKNTYVYKPNGGSSDNAPTTFSEAVAQSMNLK